MADTIANIAEQTNLLALNAAIEAAMTEEITATVDEVSSALQGMAQMAGEVFENSTAIGNSVNEASQGMDQVAVTAQSQAELAQKLIEIVQKFKI